ncbi:MAG: POTRA domain-containing protein, partial [Syntrophales bacterium]|nr:POTRA domain-containing protein [Syntrophales bacterium]
MYISQHRIIDALVCLFAALLLILLPAKPMAWGQSGGSEPHATLHGDQVITKITIKIPPEYKEAPTLKLMARDLLFLKEGDLLSVEALEQSITALGLSKRFSHISVDSRETDNAFDLFFELTPAPLVRDIGMRGIYPYFQRDIRNVMTMGPGDPVTDSNLREQEGLIRAFYIREGFIDPRVSVKAEGDPREGSASLRIFVTKGRHYRLEELLFKGNHFFSDRSLRTMIGAQRSRLLPGQAGRFIEESLALDVRNLLQRYRTAGFAECSINKEVRKDPISAKVSVTLAISEGPRYEIDMVGNRALSRRELEDDFTFFKEGNRNDANLNRSVRNMINRYRSRGYPDVRIITESETTEADGLYVRSLRFVIEEGARHRTGFVRITGTETIDEKTVRGWLRGGLPEFREGRPWLAEHAESASFTITSAYRALGFLNASTDTQ